MNAIIASNKLFLFRQKKINFVIGLEKRVKFIPKEGKQEYNRSSPNYKLKTTSLLAVGQKTQLDQAGPTQPTASSY